MKKPLPERIAALKARKEQMALQLSRLETRAKHADRKRDTRRKIVIGAAVLSEMERTPRFRQFVCEMLGKAVTRPQDRDTIADLIGAPGSVAPVMGPAAEAVQVAAHQLAAAEIALATASIESGGADYRTFSKAG